MDGLQGRHLLILKIFTFNLPISIAEEIIKNIHVNMDVKIGKNINRNDEFEGNNLKGFVDILYILFENAIKIQTHFSLIG